MNWFCALLKHFEAYFQGANGITNKNRVRIDIATTHTQSHPLTNTHTHIYSQLHLGRIRYREFTKSTWALRLPLAYSGCKTPSGSNKVYYENVKAHKTTIQTAKQNRKRLHTWLKRKGRRLEKVFNAV